MKGRGAGRPRRPLRTIPIVGTLVLAWEDRLTARGRYLFCAVAVFALVGLDTRRTQVYALFALAVGALLPALFYEAFPRPRVKLDCELPARATALTPVPVRARVTAVDRAETDLRLAFPRPLVFGGSIEVRPPEAFVSVTPEAPAEVTVTFEALRRGKYELRGPTVRATDPLRLAAGRSVTRPPKALLVYPRYYTMERFDIPLGRRYQPGGIPLSSSTGDAIEFVGTRDYREGDPVKNIHWRSWARRGQPVVKEYQEEYFCRIAIVLDTFVAPGSAAERSFEAGISVVASIADYFSRSEYVVDILAAGPDVYEVSAGRSLAYLENILDVLAVLNPCPDPPFATIGPHLFERLEQITTVVAVLQDWDPPREAFLRRVKSLGTAVRAIVVRDGETTAPWERAVEEIGAVDRMTTADVERAIEASHGPARTGPGRAS